MTAAIHIGNVTEFNDPSFTPDLAPEELADRIAGCDEYASMAPFYTADPGVVVIPAAAQQDLDRWAEAQSAPLRWEAFEPVACSGDSRSICATLDQLRAVRDALATGSPVIAWGETAGFRDFVGRNRADALLSVDPDAASRLDSKLHQATVLSAAFDDLGRPEGLTVPAQQVLATERELLRALTVAGAAGHAVILKAPAGVGGSGSVVFLPHRIATTDRARRNLDSARSKDGFIGDPPLVLQRWYPKRVNTGDLTTDFEVDADGGVSCRGTARMLVDGTHYRGAVTVTQRSVDVVLAEEFGAAVARRIADDAYRGWFDIDFVCSPSAGLVPVEINARRTGPTVALTIRDRLRALSARSVEVGVHDMMLLPRRMKPAVAFDHLAKVTDGLGMTGQVVPTLTTATAALTPYLGVAVVAETTLLARSRLDAVQDAVVG